jgi:vacuolar protein sorting-associated protein 45
MILDDETSGIASLAVSQSDLLAREVFLFEKLANHAGTAGSGSQLAPHLTGVVFVRPTDANIRLLDTLLSSQLSLGKYHLIFSNRLPSSALESLAAADIHEAVGSVLEMYADFYPLSSTSFSLNSPKLMLTPKQSTWAARSGHGLKRHVDGLASYLLASRRVPPCIRYVHKSGLAGEVASELVRRITKADSQVFSFRVPQEGRGTVLLVLDRKDDPVTPLLSQWTYEAMVHELLGIHKGRVDLSKAPGVKKDLQEVELTERTDSFFAQRRFDNFGDLSEGIQHLVMEYQKRTQTHQKVDSIADIRRFVEDFPEFRKLEGKVSKNAAIVFEMSRLVEQRSLYNISELEQELANKQDHGTAKMNVMDMLAHPQISDDDKVRLVMLYTLRYESAASNATGQMIDALRAGGTPQEKIRAISAILEYAGAGRRAGDVFSNKSLGSIARSALRRGLKGAVNVYTEHRPALVDTVENLLKNKLKPTEYPVAHSTATITTPTELIIFMVGGFTHEEVLACHEMSEEHGIPIILGGSDVHNTQSFVRAVVAARES